MSQGRSLSRYSERFFARRPLDVGAGHEISQTLEFCAQALDISASACDFPLICDAIGHYIDAGSGRHWNGLSPHHKFPAITDSGFAQSSVRALGQFVMGIRSPDDMRKLVTGPHVCRTQQDTSACANRRRSSDPFGASQSARDPIDRVCSEQRNFNAIAATALLNTRQPPTLMVQIRR
jgi:hypothetical protein